MPQFIKVATTDELADDQAKLVEVEGQKIALFRVDGGFKCARDPLTLLLAYCSVQGRMSNAKIYGVLTVSSGQDPKADHGTAIGSREASDPDALRSGREG